MGKANEPDFGLLSEDWKSLLDTELKLLDGNRTQIFDLWKKQIAERAKYLKKWLPGPTKQDLEKKYSQSEIDTAEAVLQEWQQYLDDETSSLTEALKTVTDSLSGLEEESKTVAKALQESLEYKSEQLSLKVELQKEVERLKTKLKEAQGTKWEALIQQDLDDAKAKLARLTDPDYFKALDDAIRDDLDALQKVWEKIVEWTVNGPDGKSGKEALEIEIEAYKKKGEYLKQHWNSLVEAWLEQPESPHPDQP